MSLCTRPRPHFDWYSGGTLTRAHYLAGPRPHPPSSQLAGSRVPVRAQVATHLAQFRPLNLTSGAQNSSSLSSPPLFGGGDKIFSIATGAGLLATRGCRVLHGSGKDANSQSIDFSLPASALLKATAPCAGKHRKVSLLFCNPPSPDLAGTLFSLISHPWIILSLKRDLMDSCQLQCEH